jgi:hypothetical protein
MVNLLDNFLKLLKLFLAVVSSFMKSLLCRMEGGKERTMNSRPATASQVRDSEKRLKQKLLQIESAIKNIYSRNLSSERFAR